MLQHHPAVHCETVPRRAANARKVRDKLAAAGFVIEQLTWANTVLFPPSSPSGSWKASPTMGRPKSPTYGSPRTRINAVLEQAIAVKAFAIPRRVPLPFGLVLPDARAE